MDAYTDPSFWDNTPAFTQLPDSDFFALLQKQFPPITDAIPFVGVNPQSLSSYSLPSLTPPSEDSSPSPSISNHEVANDDINEAPLKRKASREDLSDTPNQKAQHTASSPSDKKGNGTSAKRKSAGHAPKDEGRLIKRKEQNRAAQRAFRERKEKHVKDLEDKVAELEAKNEQALNENENLRDLLVRLRNENVTLKQSSFTFTAPKIPIKSLDTAELPKFVSAPSAHSVATSPATSELVSPKTTNPLDWSSLSTFDPAILTLLDDSVPQPTATEGAMQLDFGFGRNTGLASNTPYTTIASNPKFMSFASTFDSPSNSSAPGSNSFVSNPFNFDMSSMSSWSPPPTNSQDAQLDDLFSGYLSTMNSGDFSMQSESSVSDSPVSHHIATSFTGISPNSSSSLPSAAQANRPSPDSSSSMPEKHPCRSKMLKELITHGEPSPFARGIRESATTIPCGEDATFPKTAKSEKNIEVLTAWKNITSDPKFKDVDISSLCSEFTSKARCDGTRVVLEPQEVNSILETLSNKQ